MHRAHLQRCLQVVLVALREVLHSACGGHGLHEGARLLKVPKITFLLEGLRTLLPRHQRSVVKEALEWHQAQILRRNHVYKCDFRLYKLLSISLFWKNNVVY